jgi:hypothetical protein
MSPRLGDALRSAGTCDPAKEESMAVNASDSFYISVMGEEQGPYTLMQLKQMLESGQIRQGDTTARWAKEGSQWFPIAQIPGLVSDKQWVIALILSVFVGTLGIDRFYVGHIGLGVLKLITCGGIGIWWVIDIILVAVDRMRDSNGLPLRR